MPCTIEIERRAYSAPLFAIGMWLQKRGSGREAQAIPLVVLARAGKLIE